MPVEELPPATPFTSHVTVVVVLLVLDEFTRFTVAVNSAVPLIGTLADVGVIEIEDTVPVPPELPPQAVRMSAHVIATAGKDSSRSLFRIGKIFPRFCCCGPTAAPPANGHTAPCVLLEDAREAGVARATLIPPGSASGQL